VAAANVVGALGAGQNMRLAHTVSSDASGRYSKVVAKALSYFLRAPGGPDPRQKTEGKLAADFGLQANLPANHPHKTSAPTVA